MHKINLEEEQLKIKSLTEKIEMIKIALSEKPSVSIDIAYKMIGIYDKD